MVFFQDLKESLKTINVLCVGDVVLDRYVMGEAHRLSPEAPVAVLHASKEKNKLGGAGNVIHNLSALGVPCCLHGLIGKDEAGQEICSLLDKLESCSYYMPSISNWRTVEKTRFMTNSKHMLRVDFEEKLPVTEAHIVELFESHWREMLKKVDVLILSDYGKGYLRPSCTKKIIEIAREMMVPVIVDPKGIDFRKYTGADIITPNKSELSLATGGLPVDTMEDCLKAARQVLETVDIKGILVTRGADGMAYITKTGLQKSLGAKVREVHDVSGAGDTVVAVTGIGMALGWPMEKTMELSTVCAGKVVGKVGTAVIEMNELDELLKVRSQGYNKSCDVVLNQVRKWQQEGLVVGFTNGCFDIIHKGHLSLLDFAKSKCDKLVVGLNSDLSVKNLKGPKRPVQDEHIRGRVLSSLHEVDGVVLFEEETPYELIKRLQPDVLIKGQDYKVEEIAGSDIVLGRGGHVYLAPILEGYSTTGSLNNL